MAKYRNLVSDGLRSCSVYQHPCIYLGRGEAEPGQLSTGQVCVLGPSIVIWGTSFVSSTGEGAFKNLPSLLLPEWECVIKYG